MRKITRIHLEKFLRKYAYAGNALEVGVAANKFTSLFPNTKTLDIDPKRNPDIIGDLHDLPFPEASWDFILCLEVLEHVENPQKAVNELFRVLRPGGTLILTTQFLFPVHDAPADYWRFTPNGLKKLFPEWRIKEFSTGGGAFTSIAILLQRILFQTDMRGGKFTKGILYLVMYIFSHLDGLILNSYGDISKRSVEKDFLVSGLYLVLQKP